MTGNFAELHIIPTTTADITESSVTNEVTFLKCYVGLSANDADTVMGMYIFSFSLAGSHVFWLVDDSIYSFS